MWVIENKYSKSRPFSKTFTEKEDADAWVLSLGPFLSTEWTSVHSSDNPVIDRMINEGLEKNDLEGIILPRISIDEYIPADTSTDNIVIAFFVKGVPEAVIPFQNFCEKCNGVLDVDYGDSDIIVNASIVYVEMDREKINLDDVKDLITQVCMLSGLSDEDFTVTFPHTNTKFPYNLGLIKKYFDSRTERDNKIAQVKAQRKAEVEYEKMLQNNKSIGQRNEPPTSESLIDKLVNVMLTETKI